MEELEFTVGEKKHKIKIIHDVEYPIIYIQTDDYWEPVPAHEVIYYLVSCLNRGGEHG